MKFAFAAAAIAAVATAADLPQISIDKIDTGYGKGVKVTVNDQPIGSLTNYEDETTKIVQVFDGDENSVGKVVAYDDGTTKNVDA